MAKILLYALLIITQPHHMEASEMDTDVSTISGIIIDKTTQQPLPGATIYIRELEIGRIADSEGKFEFGALDSGTYTIQIRLIGYDNRNVKIHHPDRDVFIFELSPMIFVGEDIIITASPLGKNIHYQPAQAMNAALLQQNAASGLGEILEGNPGVANRSFGSAPARPVIRGMDGDRVLILQNGERMGDFSGTAADHAVALDPLSMDRIEIVRGPASLLYGSSALGGVVNLFSNDMPRDWDAGSSGTIASHAATVNGMGSALARFQHGSESMALNGRIIYRDSGDIRTPDGRLSGTSMNNLSYGGGMGFRSSDIITTGISMNGMNYTYVLPEEMDNPDERIEIRMYRSNLQSVSTYRLNRFIEYAELRLQYNRYGHDEIEVEIEDDGSLRENVEISFKQNSISSSLLMRHSPVGKLEGVIGLSTYYSQLTVGGAEALTPNANSYYVAGYIYEEISLNRMLSVKAGSRLELKETFVKTNELFKNKEEFQNRSDLIFSGALGLHMMPDSRWGAAIQVARAFRTPTIEELYANAPHLAAGTFEVGDPTLRNEISYGIDAFLNYRTNRFTGQFSIFLNRIHNFVEFSPTGEIHFGSGFPIFEYRSTNALLGGFEWFIQAKLWQNITADLSLDYVRGQETGGDRNNLSFMPPLRLQAAFKYETNKYWLGPRFRAVSTQNHVAENEDPTKGYLLFGINAGYHIQPNISLTFRVDNLFNTSYRDHLSRIEERNNPMPARNFNAMLRWDF